MKDTQRWIFEKHSYKCILHTCVEFSKVFVVMSVDNALFHIFSGPLFANVEGYEYLDLIIWGLSPMVFLSLRPQITTYIEHNKHYMKSLTYTLLKWSMALVLLSYMFMNYSPLFNWNYFSRSFNLDFGYFIFDFLMRIFTVPLNLTLGADLVGAGGAGADIMCWVL